MIYLDHHASTPCDPKVVEAMLPFFTSDCANAASGFHAMGRGASAAVERARAQVATCFGGAAEHVVFTSGATESNNLVLLGLSRNGRRKKIVTSSIEHKSVLGPCDALVNCGFEVVRLPVDKVGRVNTQVARVAVDESTLLVSVQAANNEIGTIQDVHQLADIAHENGALFHCDAAQALGKIALDVETMGIDLMSVSGHKVYGPKGIGALYVQTGAVKQITPLMYGGGQEQGLRPGTLPVPLCVGFGEACRLANDARQQETERIGVLRDRLQVHLLSELPRSRVNGDPLNRLAANISLTIPGVDAESLALALRDVALSTGAACNSGAQEPSYVLRALGMDWDSANCTIRIGLGRFNTNADVDQAGAEIVAMAKRLAATN